MPAFYALIHHKKRNYGILFPDLPGCIATAATLDEVLRKGAEALAFHVEGMRLDNEPIPVPRSLKRIKAARENWIDWRDATVALVPLAMEQPSRS